MSEETNVYLNNTGKPLVVTLPDGGNRTLKAGEGIAGAYFERYTRTGSPPLMVPLSASAATRPPRVVALPGESVRFPKSDSTPAVATPVAKAPEVPTPSPTPEPDSEVESEESTFNDETAEEWTDWLKESSDNTVLHELKVADMRGLAEFLGTAHDGATKLELLAAIRTHTQTED
jgi:hypothetical protein